VTNPHASDHVHLAIEVLKKASLFDPAFSKPDHGMALAWAEALSKYKFDVRDCLDGVSLHYENHRERITVADVIRNARGIRKERAEREKATEARAIGAAPPASDATRNRIMQWAQGKFGIDRDLEAVARLDPPPASLADAHQRLAATDSAWDIARVAKAMHKWNVQRRDGQVTAA
jgi:hypothetical protein